MYFKGFLFVLFFIIYLSSVSVLSAGDMQVDTNTKTAVEHLHDYYDEFCQPVIINDNCSCNLDLSKQQDPLVNYYSEFLK